jgi:hypothetical protein
MIYNKNNDINKNTDIKKITDIVNNCEYKQKHKICETKFNMKIYNKIYTNNGIINMNNINIKYIYEILNYNIMVNNNKKYILYLSKTKIKTLNYKLDKITNNNNDNDIYYYTLNNIIICDINHIIELLPYFDDKYKNYDIKHVIHYSSIKYLNISDIKSDNFIWYLLSNNRNLNKIKNALDKTIYEKIVHNHYININLDINYIPNFHYDDYLYKQIKKIYTSEFNNFNTELLEKDIYKIINNYKPNKQQDILIFFIIQFNDKYPNYYINLEYFKNNYQCCILYDYPDKLSITKCCNNILDYESCINYFNQSNKCCICRKNFDSNKIDQHIYVHK